jgi:hypothetical protein
MATRATPHICGRVAVLLSFRPTARFRMKFEFPPNGAFQNEIRERWLSTFRGRAGYAYQNSLLYMTGGAVWATVHNDQFGPPGVDR